MTIGDWSWVWAAIALLVFAIIVKLFTRTDPDPMADRIGGETIPLDALPTFRSYPPGVYSAVLIRQSGNLHRDLGTFSSAQAALQEAVKSFRRAKVTHVRVVHATDTELAAYREYYNLKGTAEGRKFAGVRLVQLSVAAPPPAPPETYSHRTGLGLDIKLVSVVKGQGDTYTLNVEYGCGNCGGTDVASPSATDPMKCPDCGAEFETLGEAQAVQRGELLARYMSDRGYNVLEVKA